MNQDQAPTAWWKHILGSYLSNNKLQHREPVWFGLIARNWRSSNVKIPYYEDKESLLPHWKSIDNIVDVC